MTRDPGRLNRRLVLEAPAETDDGAGGVVRTFVEVATLWAAVTPVSATHGSEADAQGATVAWRVVMRLPREITTRHRLRLGGRILRVLAVRDPGFGFLEIDAEEWTD